MADIYEHNGLAGYLAMTTGLANGNYVLGDGSHEVTSTLVLHVVKASGTLSITVKARSSQKDARRDGNHETFQPVPYTRRNVAGTVSDDTTVSAAIADTGIFKVDVTGLQPSLEINNTSGVGSIYWKVLQGAAA